MPKYIETAADFNKIIGNKIKRLRLSKGWVRKQLAKELNVSHQQVSKYEDGIGSISVCRLNMICEIFEVSFAHFIDDKAVQQENISTNLTIETVRSLSKLTYKQQKSVNNLVRCMVLEGED